MPVDENATDVTYRARVEIGRRLRVLRVDRGMSLREAASRAGLSASFVGLVERGATEIAISRLIRLADVYGALVADLLADVHERRIEFVAAADALSIDTNTAGVEVLYLASPSWSMEPFMVRLAPGAQLEHLSHASEEFIHCIEGMARLTVGDQIHSMAPGDTLLVPSTAEHAYSNESGAPTVLLGAVARPETGQHGSLPLWGSQVQKAPSAPRG